MAEFGAKIVKRSVFYIKPGQVKPDAKFASLGIRKLMDFIKDVNSKSLNVKIPEILSEGAEWVFILKVTVYSDGSYDLEFGSSPVRYLLLGSLGLKKGSSKTKHEMIANLENEKIARIVSYLRQFIPKHISNEAITKSVVGTALSMGITIS